MTKTVHPPRARACLAAAVASLSILPLAAQTLPETRVTATRFSEPASTLPLGVSVITADQIRAAGATTVNDAIVRLLGVPGRLDLSNGNDTSFDLRGFGATADANQVVILDGLRLSEGDLAAPRLAGIPIESIERIEVLRGSGAVLYGEGATGGVIVITTRSGAGKQRSSGGTAYAAAGSEHLRELRASGTVVTPNGFAIDADAQKRKSDGFRQNAASDQEAGSVTGQWSDDWLRLGARVARDDLDARLPGSLTPAQYAADPTQSNTPNDHGSIRNERAQVFAQADVGNWQLAFDAGQRDKEVRSEFGGFAADYDVAAHNYSVRGRHQAKIGNVTNILVLGVDRNDWARTNNSFGADTRSEATALFAKDDVVFATGTRASFGARTEKIHKDGGGVVLDDRQHAWELGLSHPIATDWTAWFRVGHSYRLPNADEFSFMRPDEPLRPQESTDTEAGARWTYGAGRLEGRLYHSALKDEIGFDPDAPRTFFGANVNFDPTRREGVELDWNHSLTAALGLQVNAAVRRATFRSGPYQGKDVPLVPREALAVRADWVPVAGHRLNAGVNWVGSQFVDYQNACRIPSHVTADARYAWQFHRNAEFALGVTNLFDRQFYTQAFGCFGGEIVGIYPEAGRQFTASVRVQF
ncbi:TonB-dependent receptor [Ramlibacter sp. USB13]|uniref:TonB-dependent receptor n=1 Tax=Ramlibacter cellulosilyticus TaxID=2764187 RepID=A0A923MPQ1_9BURK|nr:TonB-dependent receptor [Ramlibacter cellulosilyticus]MBC5783215.1 TonB-dependent receptor [Ramlibacter cellulosilyticus]